MRAGSGPRRMGPRPASRHHPAVQHANVWQQRVTPWAVLGDWTLQPHRPREARCFAQHAGPPSSGVQHGALEALSGHRSASPA
eukprot:SAG31_NODE_5865_length_2283_cov_4.999580_4_plen_83_part_00